MSLYGGGNGWCLMIDTLWEQDIFHQEGVYFEQFLLLRKTDDDSYRAISGVGGDAGAERWFIAAEVGDEVNAETSRDESKLFYTNAKPRVKPEYTVGSPGTLYLGFSLEKMYSLPQEVYGWVELIVDGDELRLGNTCLDLSGRPVIVGVRSAEPIPEPATGALALCGAALLFRRRRRAA